MSVTFLRAWVLSLLTTVSTGCGCSDIPVGVDVRFGEQGTTLQVGDTTTLGARVLNSGDLTCVRYTSQAGLGGPVRPDRFTYESSRPDVATISDRGLVTALQPGLTNIRVSAEGLVSTPVPVTVKAPPP